MYISILYYLSNVFCINFEIIFLSPLLNGILNCSEKYSPFFITGSLTVILFPKKTSVIPKMTAGCYPFGTMPDHVSMGRTNETPLCLLNTSFVGH